PSTEWSQIQSADALLLSKPDLASDAQRLAFAAIAAAQYPAKRYVAACEHGELPEATLGPFDRTPMFSLLPKNDPVTSSPAVSFSIGETSGSETHSQQLGLWGVQWTLPRELQFAR